MKKNVMMRLSALLLVAVLLTTCVISGTFAKYVTTEGRSDSARVAKWGVIVAVVGDTTTITETDGTAEGHVVSNEGELLAPGTAGQLLNVTITGTPEVAVAITYTPEVTLTGWEAEGYYCPLVVYVNGVAVDTTGVTDAAGYEAAIEAAIVAKNEDVAAGKTLEAIHSEVVITWEWAFESSNDVKDTILGNAAANGNAPTITVNLTATVTQVN